MATIACNNRGCFKTSIDSLLDEKSNEVICAECGKTITGVSEFMKRSMKGMGKVVKNQAKSSYSVECTSCKKVGQPIINDKNEIACSSCGNVIKLTIVFEKMFREFKHMNKGSDV